MSSYSEYKSRFEKALEVFKKYDHLPLSEIQVSHEDAIYFEGFTILDMLCGDSLIEQNVFTEKNGDLNLSMENVPFNEVTIDDLKCIIKDFEDYISKKI